MRSIIVLLSSVLVASNVLARTYTTTLPYEDGNTLVVAVTTDALGDVLTNTLSTITAAGTQSSTSTTLTNTRIKITTATGPVTTTGQRVVGVDSTAAPMRTTTYWYDPGDGVWTVATWTASITAAPTVATAIVPEGTIIDYNSYQTVVNSVVLASAEAAAATNGSSGAASRMNERTAGWAAVVVGAGLGALVL